MGILKEVAARNDAPEDSENKSATSNGKKTGAGNSYRKWLQVIVLISAFMCVACLRIIENQGRDTGLILIVLIVVIIFSVCLTIVHKGEKPVLMLMLLITGPIICECFIKGRDNWRKTEELGTQIELQNQIIRGLENK